MEVKKTNHLSISISLISEEVEKYASVGEYDIFRPLGLEKNVFQIYVGAENNVAYIMTFDDMESRDKVLKDYKNIMDYINFSEI